MMDAKQSGGIFAIRGKVHRIMMQYFAHENVQRQLCNNAICAAQHLLYC